MKAVALPAPGKVEIVELPMPAIREYECLVRVLACGFCNSTDLKTIDDHLGAPVPFPVILGHEGVGEVVETGKRVRNWKVGDRMTNPHGRLPDGGPYNRYWAGMVEYAVVQDHEVMREMGLPEEAFEGRAARRIPATLHPPDAGVVLMLCETLSALDNFGFRPGMDVLVFGDGPVGLGLCTFLRRRGAGWIGCLGHHPDRLARMAGAGVDLAAHAGEADLNALLGDRHVDLVIDAVGRTAIVVEGAGRLKPRGKVGIYGVLPNDDARLDLLALPNNVGIHKLCYPYRELEAHGEIVRLAQAGEMELKAFYSHVLPMKDIARCVELIRSREAFKVILEI